jgi:hypothetical protein
MCTVIRGDLQSALPVIKLKAIQGKEGYIAVLLSAIDLNVLFIQGYRPQLKYVHFREVAFYQLQ